MRQNEPIPEISKDSHIQSPAAKRRLHPTLQRPVHLTMILSIVIGVVVMRGWIMEGMIVDGHSMDPTLQNRERLVVLKEHYSDTNIPARGTIITFPAPADGGCIVKRVVGLPGEKLEMRGTQVYINALPLDEPYAHATLGETQRLKVPPGQVFVMGDNRDNSDDSRNFGPIDLKTVRGRAAVVVWPLSNAKRV